jgi:peptidyl-prolyl cis-trans isomerase D
MLQTLHDKLSGPVAWGVLILITVAFGGFFGIQQYINGPRNASYVAMVDGHEISQQAFRERYDAYRSQMQRMLRQGFDAAAFDTPERKREVLDRMINEQLLLDANEKLGTAVTATAIRNEIMSYPAFQVDGKFNPDQYRLLLNAQHRTAAQFEDEVRRDLDLRQTAMQLEAAGVVTEADVDRYLRLRDQTRDFRFVTLDKPAIDTKIDDAEIEAYYRAHTDQFQTPERVSIDYVELDAAKLAAPSSVDDATLKKRYDEQKARFVTPEQRLASHILVKVAKNADAAAQKAALEKAERIAKEAKAGKDFAALAKAESDDSGSKAQGGDLGWLEKGVTDPAFESALFALKKGDISDPVRSDEGYHVIQLRDVRPEKVRPFEEVKGELAKKYLDEEREREYTELSGKLTDAVLQDPTSLAAAARNLGLSVQKAGPFTRAGGEGIAANPAVVKAAFSTPVLAEGNASDPIELGPNHIVILRVDQHEKPEAKPLAEVRDEIRRKLTDQALAKAARERAETLYARLDKGETLAGLAAELKLKVQEQKEVGRNAVNLERPLVDAVFALPRPQADKPVVGKAELRNDTYALIELVAVKDGDPSKLDAKTREAARNQLRQSMAEEAVRGYIDSLRKRAKIEIAEDRLQ